MGILNWIKGSTPGTRKTVVIDGVTYCATVGGAPPTMNLTQMAPGACQVDPGTEPPGRVRRASVVYPPGMSGGIRDLLTWTNLLGRINPTQPERPFPGSPCNVIVKNIPRGGYIALEFNLTGLDPALDGAIKSVSNFPGAHIDMCIHALPGRFEGATPYFKTDIPPDDNPFLHWRLRNGTGFFCQLPTRGYLNLRLSDPSAVGNIHVASTF